MSDLFDEEFFTRLARLRLAGNIRLDRGQTGARKSSAKGVSVEFSDFREYLPGDDIRRIDWNAYGRFDRLYVKQFMEEKEANYHIFIDASRSMDFGQEKKSVMALRLAAVFAWLVLGQLDRVELLTFQEGIPDKLAPVTGRSSFGNVLRSLERVEFKNGTGINDAVRRGNFNGRGVSIVISDFLEPEGIEDAVRFLKYKRQDILMIQVLAREETDFEGEGTVVFQDLETGETVRVTLTRNNIHKYTAALQDYKSRLSSIATRYGCSYLPVVSDMTLEHVVFDVLRQKGIFG